MNSAVIVGALIGGIVIGLIPAVCGAVKEKIGLAIGGFFACVVASFILGLLLSVPVCAVFLFFIFKKPKDTKNTAVPTQSSAAVGPLPGDRTAQLRKLQELKDAGMLSEEEFQDKQRQIAQTK